LKTAKKAAISNRIINYFLDIQNCFYAGGGDKKSIKAKPLCKTLHKGFLKQNRLSKNHPALARHATYWPHLLYAGGAKFASPVHTSR